MIKIRCTRCRTRTSNWKPSLTFVGHGIYEQEKLCTECQRKRAAVVRAARTAYADRIEVVRSTLAGRVRSFLARVLNALLRKVTS